MTTIIWRGEDGRIMFNHTTFKDERYFSFTYDMSIKEFDEFISQCDKVRDEIIKEG